MGFHALAGVDLDAGPQRWLGKRWALVVAGGSGAPSARLSADPNRHAVSMAP